MLKKETNIRYLWWEISSDLKKVSKDKTLRTCSDRRYCFIRSVRAHACTCSCSWCQKRGSALINNYRQRRRSVYGEYDDSERVGYDKSNPSTWPFHFLVISTPSSTPPNPFLLSQRKKGSWVADYTFRPRSERGVVQRKKTATFFSLFITSSTTAAFVNDSNHIKAVRVYCATKEYKNCRPAIVLDQEHDPEGNGGRWRRFCNRHVLRTLYRADNHNHCRLVTVRDIRQCQAAMTDRDKVGQWRGTAERRQT